MSTPRVHIHVTTRECGYPGCALACFHFHWRGQVHYSAHDGSLTSAELLDFDADCHLDNADRRAMRDLP